MHYNLTTLPNGLRIITQDMPSIRSVSIGMWVDTGSRDELPIEAGSSHFLEHLLFKGSEKMSAHYIGESLDAVGPATTRSRRRNTPATGLGRATMICLWH